MGDPLKPGELKNEPKMTDEHPAYNGFHFLTHYKEAYN